MDALSKKLQNLGIHDIRNAARFAQNVIVQYEPYQIDIRRATNTDSWGPTPKHLSKVLRNRYQVPMYLMTEYILKRLIDHIAQRPKNLYEKARKEYVNYGSEWRVVLKCLVVLEFLLLNVDEGDELNQIKSCLNAHKHILTREVSNFKIKFSNDGKMEVHERGIKKKNELILQYLDDLHFLKRERLKNKKNSLKIKNNNAAGGFNNDLTGVISGQHNSHNHPSYSGDHVMDTVQGFDYDFDEDADDNGHHRRPYNVSSDYNNKQTDLDDFDDEFNEFTVRATATSNSLSSFSSSSATPNNNVATHDRSKQVISLEEQRRQRREILRERIRTSEQQRKNREQMKLQQQKQQEQQVPDLLDLDFDSTPTTSTNTNTNTNNSNSNNANNLASTPTSNTTNLNVFGSSEAGSHVRDEDNEDDGFGDFQSEPSTTTINNTTNKNASTTLDDLLNGNNISTNNTTTNNNNIKSTSLNDKDLFADLFNNSKSLI